MKYVKIRMESRTFGGKVFRFWAAAIFFVLLFLIAAADYLSWYSFSQYKAERKASRSIEAGFPQLEAALQRAVRFSKNPAYYKELTRLYLERAMAENEFGSQVARDAVLDRAETSARKWIRQNPVDAWAYYELGKIYLLYNFPLLTYADKGRRYLRKAIELKPADEFLNQNVLYIFMTQWERLEEREREFVAAQWRSMTESSPNFERELRRRWQKNFNSSDGLDLILIKLD
jgi:hypothetical protein